jgi:hypothetical protein
MRSGRGTESQTAEEKLLDARQTPVDQPQQQPPPPWSQQTPRKKTKSAHRTSPKLQTRKMQMPRSSSTLPPPRSARKKKQPRPPLRALLPRRHGRPESHRPRRRTGPKPFIGVTSRCFQALSGPTAGAPGLEKHHRPDQDPGQRSRSPPGKPPKTRLRGRKNPT